VTVLNVAPTVLEVIAAPTSTPDWNVQVSIVATFADVGTLDTHTATIDWGDGSPLDSGVVTEVGGSGSVFGSHVYTHIGPHTVTVTVDDGDGGSAADTLAIQVFCTDPVGDINDPEAGADADLIRCGASNTPETLSVMLQVEGTISRDVQYRVYLDNGVSFKYSKGKAIGPSSLTASVDVNGNNTLTFQVDLVELGLVAGDSVQLFFETQAGVKGGQSEGKPDRMPDSGLLLYTAR